MIASLDNRQHIFFIGIAGSGMSALAQYLAGTGKSVSGSDRFFAADQPNETKDKLEAEGIQCFFQNGSGITDKTDLVIASTAVEETNVEIQKAKTLKIPVLLRSELLTVISNTKRTIAVGGTSGKSTTTALLFDILDHDIGRDIILVGIDKNIQVIAQLTNNLLLQYIVCLTFFV